MPRSAAQRAACLLTRQTGPVFPFIRLPAELQLLVLCKCDLVSVKKLLKLSLYLRSLVRRYPETTVKNLLAQLPAPVKSLLRVSYELDSVECLSDLALYHMCRVHLLDWSLIHERILIDNAEPLDTIQGLIALYVEVDEAVECIAQGKSAAMETFLESRLVPSRIIVSTTERTRIACSIYLIKIFLRLQSMYDRKSHYLGRGFLEKFLRSQKPWLIEQVLSIESFLEVCRGQDIPSIYKLVDRKFICKDKLSKKSFYIRIYLATLDDDGDVTRRRFADAAQSLRQVHTPHPSWRRKVSDLDTRQISQRLRHTSKTADGRCLSHLLCFNQPGHIASATSFNLTNS